MNNLTKYGLFVITTKKNYIIEIIFTLIYFVLFLISSSQNINYSIIIGILSALIFFRFIESQLTGITIQILFVVITGKGAKFLSYLYLIISLFVIFIQFYYY